MDHTRMARWFAAVFRGEWIEVTDLDAPPSYVLEDSQQWAAELLRDRANPYAEARLLRQRMFLGLGTSPDKLVTRLGDAGGSTEITIHETLQDFIVTRAVTSSGEPTVSGADDALSKVRSELVPVLSDEAGRMAQELLDEFLARAVTVTSDVVSVRLVSSSDLSLEAITNWYDRVNLVWLESRFYLSFYKTYPSTAVGSFRPGLNWYPQELRIETGAER